MEAAKPTVESAESLSVLEAMNTMRSVRHLKKDPVPREIIERLIYHATRAASGDNRQSWEWVVITDPEKKRRLRDIVVESTDDRYVRVLDKFKDARMQSSYKNARYLTHHMDEVPVLILVCIHVEQDEAATEHGFQRSLATEASSIYPAIQNLMLAARAYGLGTVLTTAFKRHGDAKVRELFSIPEGVETVAIIPVGYPENPAGAFKPVQRRPIEEVLHWEEY